MREPSMAINISQMATIVIFWNRVFFLCCIIIPAFQVVTPSSLPQVDIQFQTVRGLYGKLG